MPVHDLGYRNWDGLLDSPLFRWWIVAQTGIRLAWRSQWLRRLMLVAWLPAAYLSIGIFTFERAMGDHMLRRAAMEFLSTLPDSGPLGFLQINSNPSDDVATWRHEVWALILHTLFRYPQGFVTVLVVGIIAPPLIARDMRSRAFLLYFSRPLTQFEYLLGKAATVWFYLCVITTLPALALYLLGVLLSPDASVLAYTWDLPLRIVAASAVLMIPTTAIALLFSAVSQESRYAGFAWFAIWIFGWVLYGSVVAASLANPNGVDARWSVVSLYHLLGNVQSWIFFGLPQEPAVAVWSVVVLGAITVICFSLLLRRISAPMQI